MLGFLLLKDLGSTPEGHHRRFWAIPFEDAGRPFSYAQQLLNAARRWLRPRQHSTEDVVEQVAQEQFVAGLPTSTANWIQCHRPASLEAAVVFAEDHLSLPQRSLKEEPRYSTVPAGRPTPAMRRRFPAADAAVTHTPTHTPTHTQTHTPQSPPTNPPPFCSLFSGSSLRVWSSGAAPQTTSSSSDTRAGLLAVRAARPLPP